MKLSNAGSWLQNKKCSDIELSTDDFTFLKVLTPGVSYSLCKVHKAIVDICPPLRPVLSVVETPTYKIVKFLLHILSCLTINDCYRLIFVCERYCRTRQ